MNRRKQLRPIILDEIEEWTQQYLTPPSIVSSNTDMNTTQCTNTSLRTQSVPSRGWLEHTDTSKNTCLLPAYIPQLPSWSTQQLDHTIPDSQPSTGELQVKMYVNYLHDVRVDSSSGSGSLSRGCRDKVGNQNTTCITDFELQHLDNLFDPTLDFNTNTSLDLELDFDDWIDLNPSSELRPSDCDLQVTARSTSTCTKIGTHQGKKSDTDSILNTSDKMTIPSFEACLVEFDLRSLTTLSDDTSWTSARRQETTTATNEPARSDQCKKRKADPRDHNRPNPSKRSSN
ncbi:uncharacterized protein L199_001321 [Kwoniella botswanensis]|uniref:uncharacterized protein n=1 Tax=Kwoniella botswanensis TaxID=1268659 RepID=UPI00315DF670